jgi:CheY-like chemotaxis protein
MILVIEDDRDSRELLCDILGLQGYVVACASNGREALSFLDAHTPSEICVILLDLMMPVMSGFEFVDRQRSDPRLASIPVVIMSARWEAREAFTGIPFVRKPIGLEELLSTIRRWCIPMSGASGRSSVSSVQSTP